MNLSDWLVRHVRLVLLLVGGLCLIGAISIFQLPVAIFPDLKIPRIIMAAEGSDAPTENILVSVTKPIEEAVSTVPGLKLVQSQTVRGSAGFTLTFVDGTDMEITLQRVQSKLAQIKSILPSNVTVTAEQLNPTVFPILDYSLSSKTRSLADLRNLALYTLRPRLARAPGVARVLVNGGDVKELVVTVKPDLLAARGIPQSEVEDAINRANTVSAVGGYDEHYIHNQVLVSGLLTDPESVRRVVVAVKNRTPITVGDVADVQEALQRKTVIATGGGRESVLLNVIRQPDGNSVQVAQEIHHELASLRALLPADVELTPFYDQSQIVSESEISVIEAIAVGGALALIVVALFLRNMRSAFVALIMLPITLLLTFAALRLLHQSLNIMTLGAIAIALGLVIDDAIVVVEHIFALIEGGATRASAVRHGLKEILPAMVASTAASVFTFMPLMLLPGVTGDFFAPLAESMIVTLLISLALSLTVVPLAARWFFPQRVKRLAAEESTTGSQRVYGRILDAALRHRAIALLMLIPLGIGAFVIGGKLETGFMPAFDEGAFVLDYRMPPGTSLQETDRVLRQVEDVLRASKGVDTWSRLTGALSGSGLEITTQNQGDIVVRLKQGKRPGADEIMDEVRGDIQKAVPNLEIEIKPILGDLIGDLAGAPSDIEVKVFGQDIDKVSDIAHEVGKRISAIKGVVDENDGVVESGPETFINVDPIRAANLGMSTDSVTAAAQGALDGDLVGSVRRGDVLEGIRVRYPFVREGSAEELGGMLIVTPGGQAVPMSSTAEIKVTPGTPELDRENQRLMVSVTARLSGLDLGSGVKEVQASLKSLALPPGYSIEYGGLYKSQQESFAALESVLLTAGLAVFAILVLSFRSLRVAVSLLVAAVASLFGVLLALWITQTPLNISSYTGAIMIVGIVTENGVLLFDEFERQRRTKPDASIVDALEQAGRLRLRPILMTSCAAILSLLPLALGIGAGAAMQKPLAIAVIGGLTLSTAFTLLLAPVLYAWLSAIKSVLTRRATREPSSVG